MSLLAGVRPLLMPNGLMIVSTNVVLDDRYIMEFNNSGRMQAEINTFWYVSVPLLDYLLRYFRLTPVDMLFWRHADARSDIRFAFDRPSAYVSVLCRASDQPSDDTWMEESVRSSWESQGLSDWDLAARQPYSSIQYRDDALGRRIDLWEAMNSRDPVPAVTDEGDSHTLRLSAFE